MLLFAVEIQFLIAVLLITFINFTILHSTCWKTVDYISCVINYFDFVILIWSHKLIWNNARLTLIWQELYFCLYDCGLKLKSSLIIELILHTIPFKSSLWSSKIFLSFSCRVITLLIWSECSIKHEVKSLILFATISSSQLKLNLVTRKAADKICIVKQKKKIFKNSKSNCPKYNNWQCFIEDYSFEKAEKPLIKCW